MERLTLVLLIGALIRFVLPTSLPSLPLDLSSSIEIATPLTSFKSLKEAFYYLQHNIDLYDGGVNHHPPLLVILLNLIDEYLPKRLGDIVFNGLYTGVDLMIASRLIHVNKWYNKHMSQRTGRSIQGFSDDMIAAFYLFNPLLILTNISHSTLCLHFGHHRVVVPASDRQKRCQVGDKYGNCQLPFIPSHFFDYPPFGIGPLA